MREVPLRGFVQQHVVLDSPPSPADREARELLVPLLELVLHGLRRHDARRAVDLRRHLRGLFEMRSGSSVCFFSLMRCNSPALGWGGNRVLSTARCSRGLLRIHQHDPALSELDFSLARARPQVRSSPAQPSYALVMSTAQKHPLSSLRRKVPSLKGP